MSITPAVAPGPSGDDSGGRAAAAIRGATTMLSDFAALSAARFGSALTSVVTVIATTRLLGPNGYGAIALVAIVANLVFTVSASWTATSVRRYGREELEHGRGLSPLTWNRALIIAPLAALSAVAVVVLKLVGALSSTMTWPFVCFAICGAISAMIATHWTALFETAGRMKASAAFQIGQGLVYAVPLTVLFLLGSHLTPKTVYALSIALPMLLVVAVTPLLWRHGLVPVEFNYPLLRRMLWLSFPLIGLMVSQYVVSSIDIVVLRMYRSQSDVGVYAVAYKAYTVLSQSAIATTSVLGPLFVSLQIAGRRGLIVRYLGRGLPQLMLLMAVIGGLGVPVLPLLVPIVFGHRFAGAAVPLALLGVGLLFLFSSYMVSPVLTLLERTRVTAVITAVAAVVNVVGDVVMIGVFHIGIIAPAVATSGALALVFVLFYRAARRLLDVRVRLDWWVMSPFVAGLVPTLVLSGLAGAGVGVTATLVVAAGVVLLRHPINREDAEMIAKMQMPRAVKRRTLKLLSFVS